MGKPQEVNVSFVVAGANGIVPVEFAGQIKLRRLAIVRADTGAIAVTLFNRQFTTPSVDCWLEPASSRYLQSVPDRVSFAVAEEDLVVVSSSSALLFRRGDIVDVTDAPGTHATYNTSARVAGISNDLRTALLELEAVPGRVPGAIALNIPPALQPLYQVIPTQTGTDALIYDMDDNHGDALYNNRDPVDPMFSYGVNRRIYVQLADVGDYELALSGQNYLD